MPSDGLSAVGLDELVEQITVDAYGDEAYWSFLQAFEDEVAFPFPATLAGMTIEVTDVDFDGNERRPLACDVEVALRNTIHDRLAAHLDRNDWWATTDLVLDDITSETLAKVVVRHNKKLAKGTIGPGKIIAALTLGTWVMLLSPR